MWGTSVERVQIFDTTLRDGEQSPGFSMTVAEKLRMAHQLQSLGVDIIEAGFPIASPGDGALSAALEPVDGCFLFFVSKNDGTNAFSCTRTEHRRLVDQYQRVSVGDRRAK